MVALDSDVWRDGRGSCRADGRATFREGNVVSYKLIPQVSAMGPTPASEAGKPCLNRNNPAGHSDACQCRQGPVRDRVKFEAWLARRDHWHQDLDDDEAEEYARMESAYVDRHVDAMREERHET